MEPRMSTDIDTTSALLQGLSVGAAIIWALKVHEPPNPLRFLAKFLSVSLLSLLAFLRGAPTPLVLALGLSSLGDASLALGRGSATLLGAIVNFLIAHVFYIALFRHHGANFALLFGDRYRLLLSVVTFAHGCVASYLILPRVKGSIRLPCAVYVGVLVTMALYAYAMPSSQIAFGGAIFVVSDTLIGVNRFYFNDESAYRLLIEQTIAVFYYSAQFLITSGGLNLLA
ncbi:YhhN family protein [Beauveria bassiana ARSEF 2860]|uniref:YhhN family protein n=1 Tax=Beauveria bassiana (strain ARSEF 2860) TaxID=655819 RepID=J5JTM8_BEAB2|nr:YhhN family protein [Beauveria bassiana ARSEF 2860]EJP65936.1 YhhN family protein [Beauveria bassiana ARSEF 2860]